MPHDKLVSETEILEKLASGKRVAEWIWIVYPTMKI